MDIPYSAAPRPDTSLTNGSIGIWLFMASETMLFGALLSSFAILRSGAAAWPDQSALLDVRFAVVNTVLLLGSSLTMAAARRAARAHLFHRCRMWAGATLFGGSAFLAVKCAEYASEIGRGLLPSTNNFLGLYYAMTGLHALHLAGGLLVVAVIAGSAARLRPGQAELFVCRVDTAAVYWHFVDAVWLCLFVMLYLI